MNVSIGILAHNEAASIESTLVSLSKQSLFQHHNLDLAIEIKVVPNGCIDDTAAIARHALSRHFSNLAGAVSWDVCEIERSGKSRAWNTYVHIASNPKAKYLILMDADIEFISEDTLAFMIAALEKFPEALVSVDRPIKDIAFKADKTLADRFSLLISALSGNKTSEEQPAWLCGQLYCARATNIRQVWLPNQLSVEDGFLYTMITTNGLQNPAMPGRIILAKSASHMFEAYTDITRLLRHEKWLILSNSVNDMIFEYLTVNQANAEHAGQQVRRLDQEDEDWLGKCIDATTKTRGWWLIPKFILLRRFLALKNKPLAMAISLFPLSILAFSVDVAIAVQANHELLRKTEVEYWGK
ncbi:MAG: glycosyltransferase [Tildeniella torsiva UHER 1998/13D]|nr:glycosyltransferase [Tildeniella torsiva UHER 1998/13D]